MLAPYCFAQIADRKFAHFIKDRKSTTATSASAATTKIILSGVIISITIIGNENLGSLKSS
jgi:hypothetical protein